MLNNLAELAAKKKEYKDGFWNVDTINLGGLGKDPEVNGKFSNGWVPLK